MSPGVLLSRDTFAGLLPGRESHSNFFFVLGVSIPGSPC